MTTQAPDAISAYWTKAGDSFDSRASHVRHAEAWKTALEAAFGPEGSRDVLDFGTGTGACALAAARLSHCVTAIDGSSGMLATARAAAAAEDLPIDFIEARFENFSLRPESFDIVTIRNVLWTLRDPASALHLARSLLRPNGRIVVSDGLWSEANDRADYNPALAGELPYHRGLSEDDIRDLLDESDFEDVESWQHLFVAHPYETMGSPSFFLVSARRPPA